MKLNTDCIRDVMLKIEELQAYTVNDDGLIERDYLGIESLYEELPKYKREDIFYALYNLEQAGYVDVTIQWAGGGVVYLCVINYMTYAGHEFLEKIRDSKQWNVVKKGLAAIRNYSLDAINAVANGAANAAITAYFEKNPIL